MLDLEILDSSGGMAYCSLVTQFRDGSGILD